MKLTYFKYLVFALAVVTTLLSGCGETEENPPTLTIDASTTASGSTLTLTGGEKQPIKIKFSAAKGTKDLKSFKLAVSYDGAVATNIVTRTIKGGTFNFDTTLQTRSVKGTEAYVITIEDEAGKTASRTLTYTVKEEGGPVIDKPIYNSASLSMNTPCLNSATGQVYTIAGGAGVASSIDITYYWSTASLDNLASPAYRKDNIWNIGAGQDYRISWGSVATEFRSTSLTQADFNRLKDEDQSKLSAEFDKGTPTQVINNPAGVRASGNAGDVVPNKILAYRAGGKTGLIWVKTAAGSATGNMSIDVIRQK
jgi:predicted component of type VI protein secretion system